jgi:hypothetical protein
MQGKYMYGNSYQGMDDIFPLQRFFVIFQEVNSWWDFSIQSTFPNSKWVWITCYAKSNYISIGVWFRYGHLTNLHISCSTTLRCKLFQAIQHCFQEKNNAMVKNNHYEPNKCTLASWVNKSLNQLLSKKISKVGLRL